MMEIVITLMMVVVKRLTDYDGECDDVYDGCGRSDPQMMIRRVPMVVVWATEASTLCVEGR